ncbi:signal recognition particle-docking protein FtsY [Flexivirga caeni]|uniref:Signal recognition particle receptor FtsY n=1 Tax=Flexivirga caeni TaxID=2294115 RepID=A0A3M9MFF8_9MICO|nr:signal recognition particle-docking protein FtsY [Flexivirga caeni]RNI24290.1 signal recognition particle-docking protein FtsY [Flexivirga caeni]
MDALWEILVIITVVVLAGLGLLVGYLRRSGTKGAPPVTPPPPAREAKTREANTYTPSSTARIDTSRGAPQAPAPAPVQPVAPEPVDVAEASVEEEVPAPAIERPESARGRMTRLRSRLASSNNNLGKGLLSALSSGKLDDAVWEEVEDTLLGADLGVDATTEIVDGLKRRVQVEGAPDAETLESWLHAELLAQVRPDMDRRIAGSRVGDRPAVIMVVGVNGTGKTTTVGKLARVLVAEDKDVVLGAADTFRAAAADQLETWGARVGVPTVRSEKEGADPAAVAFDAVKAGQEGEVDVVMIDTAGRLHNKVGLMDELAKVKRVIERQSPIDECLLVLDATTGQNGMRQAEVFAGAVDITGVVLTKLDGTAKGGIVVLVQRELGVPVKLVGLGEGADDLAPFDPVAFVDAVLD